MSHKHLKEHLPFITEMIESVKTVEFRQKWQNMKTLIEGNILTDKQIETIELNIKKAKQLKEQYQKTINTSNEIKSNEKASIIAKTNALEAENKAKKDEINDANIKQQIIDANIKQQKELRRLFENIVKDDSPLPSKRRSAQKRSYRDSLEFLLDKSPTRSQEKKVKPEPENNLKKRKSKNESDNNTTNDDSIVSPKTLKTPENKKMHKKSVEPSEVTKPVVVEPQKSSKVIRKVIKYDSAPNVKEIPVTEVKTETAKPIEIKKSSLDKLKRKIQKQQKKEALKKKSRSMLLTKGASIKKKNKVDDDEWEDMDETMDSEEGEMESTVESLTIEKLDKVEVEKTKSKQKESEEVVTKEQPPISINKVEEDEWDDINEEFESVQKKMKIAVEEKLEKIDKLAKERKKIFVKKEVGEEQKKGEQQQSIFKEKSISTPKTAPVIIKRVQNMSYIPCKNGFIFKCLIPECKFQTMDNPAFVDHIENEHLILKWEGTCEICNDKVDKVRSIIFELMHMRENHLLKEKNDPKELPDITEHHEAKVKNVQKKVSVSSKNEDNDSIPSASKNLEVKKMTLKVDRKKYECIKNDEKEKEETHKLLKSNKNIQPETESEPKQDDKSSVSVKIVGKKIDIGKIKLKPFTGTAVIQQKASLEVPQKIESDVKKPEITGSFNKFSAKQLVTSTPLSKSIAKVVNAKSQQPSTTIEKEKSAVEEKSDDSLTEQKIVKHIIVKPSVDLRDKEYTQVVVKAKVPIGPKSSLSDEKIQALIQRQKPVEVQKDVTSLTDLLRPWLRRKVKKYLMPTTRFLDNIAAIVATYKCMSSKCSFFTSEQKLFTAHLKFHEKHQPGDRDYMNCAFCDHIFSDNEGIHALVEHIDKEHCFDKYQCKYCFYRSCVSLNVINHQRVYHAMKPKAVYELNNDKNRNYDEELTAIKKLRMKYVPPIVCVKCHAKFYLFPKLSEHMKSHGTNIKTKCTKCAEVSDMNNIHTHLINCHKLGLYQCVFCIYGTNNFDTMINHIGIFHPSKPPIYCERSSEKLDETNASSIESTSLKFLTQQVDHRIIEVPKVDKELMRNEKNIGDLGGNLKVVPVKKPNLIAPPSNGSNKAAQLVKIDKTAPTISPNKTVSKVNPEKITPSIGNNKIVPAKISSKVINPVNVSNKMITLNRRNVIPTNKVASPKSSVQTLPKSLQLIKRPATKSSSESKQESLLERFQLKTSNSPVLVNDVKVVRRKTETTPSISNEKSSGLQIKSVYSLNNSK